VGANVRSLRQQNGWTVADLAARCAEVASPEMSAAVITNIELGRRDKEGSRRRDVTVDELDVLAAAFSVPPSALMPELDQDMMDVEVIFGLDDMIKRLQHLKEWSERKGTVPAAQRFTLTRRPGPALPFASAPLSGEGKLTI
jgi:transcriptional regulator with XRE-family HTH domain